MEWKEDGTVGSVVHLHGEKVDVPAHLIITKSFKMFKNFLDTDACVQQDPMPAMKLMHLFPKESENGPNSKRFIGKQKVFDELVAELHAKFKRDLDKDGRGETAKVCKAELAKL
eukprot:54055-Lingulodinium_polyedra.AAC.1